MSDKSSENDKITLRYVPLAELQLWDRNAKRHDIGALVASIERHGFQDPPKYSAALNVGAGGIVEGNGRGEALAMMKGSGEKPPRGVVARGDNWLVPVLFGNDFDSQRRAEAYAVDHNNSVMLGGDFTAFDMAGLWDEEGYKALLADLAQAEELPVSVTGEDLDALLAGLGADEPPEETPPEVDRAAELQAQYGTALGQIWRLGEHRLAVGDCTDKGVVEAVMGGKRGSMIFTDPPYRGKFGGPPFPKDPDLRDRTNKMRSSIEHLHDFDPTPFLEILSCFCNSPASYFIFCNKLLIPDYLRYAVENKMVFDILSWHKPNFIPMNSGKFYPDTEYIIKLKDKGALFKTGLPKEKVSYGTYWIIEMSSSIEGHPTEKPLKPCLDSISICSNGGDIVVDPFIGSGTTMIACENLNRKCIGIEVDPGYAAVSINRWETHTGRQAELVAG